MKAFKTFIETFDAVGYYKGVRKQKIKLILSETHWTGKLKLAMELSVMIDYEEYCDMVDKTRNS